MRATSSSWIVALVVLAASLVACGAPPDTSTTWVYDEAATLQNTESVQRASVKSHLRGYALSLRIDQGRFVMTVAGGPSPGEYRGSAKATNNGVRLMPETKDGQPVADRTAAELDLRQPDRKRMEFNVGGITASLIRK